MEEEGDVVIVKMLLIAAHGSALLEVFDETINDIKLLNDQRKARMHAEDLYQSLRESVRLHTFMKGLYCEKTLKRTVECVNFLANVLKEEPWDQAKMEHGVSECLKSTLADMREDMQGKGK